MKNKNFIAILALILIITGCSNKSIDSKNESIDVEVVTTTKLEPIPNGTIIHIDFPFPFIFWEDNTYEILLEQEISQTKLDKKIGEVERYISSTFTVTNKKFESENGDSNILNSGAEIYKIKWKSIEKEIAVEYNGKFFIAKAK